MTAWLEDPQPACAARGVDAMSVAVRDWPVISALLDEALELPAEQHARWLAGLPEGLRMHRETLQRLLADHAQVQAEAFMHELPHPALAPGAADAVAGGRVGAWRLVSRLGAGGMAEVWLADRDDGALQRQAAVKLLYRHSGLGQRAGLELRFARERDILAKLRHPHIAALYDAGVTPEGQPWLALEFVAGESILQWCDQRGLPVAERVRLFRQVLQAVQHAHEHLVIHRDLKPANILVTATGEARLLDFGIAKLIENEGQAPGESDLTRADGRPLTPSYASPEQLLGQPLTVSCDVFALGVVLYQLLAGVHPYAAGPGGTAAHVQHAILETDPGPLGRVLPGDEAAAARGLRPAALRRALAGDLDAIVQHALARQPADRYPTAQALLDDLDRWLAGQPVQARSPSRRYRLQRFAGRHRVGVALGAAAVCGLLALAGTASWFGWKANEEAARAVAARDFLLGIFRRADPEQARGATVTAGELLETGRRNVLLNLGTQPQLQGELLESIATTQAYMGQHLAALASFEGARRAQRAGGERDRVLDTSLSIAEAAWLAGDLARADAELQSLRQAAPRLDATRRARAQVLQGGLDIEHGRLEQARDDFAQAYGVAAGDAQLRYLALRGLAQVAAPLHREAEARRFFELAGEAAASAPGLTPRDRASAAWERTDALLTQGWLHEAFAVASRARTGCVQELGPHSIACRRLMDLLVLAALRLERLDGIDADVDEVRVLSAQPQAPVASAVAAMHLARFEAACGHDAALPALQAQLRALIDAGPELRLSRKLRSLAALSLADVALRRHQAALAFGLVQDVLAQDGALSADTAGWARTLQGIALLQQQRAAEALPVLDEAAALLHAALPADNPRLLLYALNRAVALAATGQMALARDLVDRALPTLAEALGADAPVLRRAQTLAATLRQGRLDPAHLPFFS